ncbi:mRNA export factor mex67 [Pleurostoma richardsiae]|uniref:mRNA export factor MEX67 n=1 Tax=Pleurostoma richardsiae TaxID=41990 RepID=A0AA38VQU5_9PEZI|nr:mRNA export factor mex67 [Pleurostoma richardsiae]
MAPPTGPRSGSAAVATRTTRSSSAPSRGGGRGGIQKRRGGAPRVDRDGDLVMDTTTTNAAKSGSGFNKPPTGPARRGGGRGGAPMKTASKLQQNLIRQLGGDVSSLSSRVGGSRGPRSPNTTMLKVYGLKGSKAASNPDGGHKSLVEFLERKASKGRIITVKKSHVSGDFVYILASHEDAEEILKLNDFSFAGSTLTITKSEESWPERGGSTGMSQTAQESKLRLQHVLEQRYDSNAKLLNLSALGQDPTLIEMGLFQKKETAEKTFKVLMAICHDLFKTAKQKREAVESVSLANNNIDFVGQVYDLAETFPDLKHLDLSSNAFQSLKQLNRWHGRFKYLETLLLNDNPIITTEPGHTTELLSWFPKLQNLSNVLVRTPEQVAAEEAAQQPRPIPQNGSDFRDVAGVGEQFLRQFFAMFDTDRNALLSVFYDEQSVFSLAVSTHTHREHSDVPVLPWTAYLKYSRNQLKITTQAGRQQRYFAGVNIIRDMWKHLPVTKHPDLVVELNKYIIDCHPIPGLVDPTGQNPIGVDGLLVTCHGEFEEIDAATGAVGKRSFSRTFTLGPGQPGRNPIRINSDLLSLRAWSPLPSLVATPAAAPTIAPGLSEEEQKQQMIVELSNRTNMTLEYSKMCLEGVNWNFDQALIIFEEKRAELPPAAFKFGA